MEPHQQGLIRDLPDNEKDQAGCYPVIIVTGLSGSGKSTALNVFEDLGFFCVDGLPVSLAPTIMELFSRENPKNFRGLALGMDLRQSSFASEWSRAREQISRSRTCLQIIYLEAASEVLVRRYAETRRPHPLEGQGIGLEQALDKEKKLLEPLRNDAHLVVDTSHFTIHDLRRTLKEKWVCLDQVFSGIRVHIISFGFKYGMPSEADMVQDLRFLPNPFFKPELKNLSGSDQAISEYVLGQDPGSSYLEKYKDFLGFILPLFQKEGRYRLTMAFGCTGGRHRSVAVAENMAEFLKESGYLISVEHRHLQLG
ncbi:RNase adapter RapZ [Desulfonatronospira sp.]|uniref:RNase adapter RapZ n=1 Tax=Desulfonatronospira sp. TaxID=1962951 RepID=UPI0025C0C64F|nr:RNase adapter RapZ [Desulfonatronospira sp.]